MAEEFRGAKIRANIVAKLKKRRRMLKESDSGFNAETLPLPTGPKRPKPKTPKPGSKDAPIQPLIVDKGKFGKSRPNAAGAATKGRINSSKSYK